MKQFLLSITLFSFIFTFSQLGEEQEAIIKSEKSKFRSQEFINKTTLPDNSGYDVLHYTLKMNIAPASTDFSGFTIIKLKAIQDISTIILDARSTLTISSVEYNNVVITSYTHSANKLQITLPSSLNTMNIAYVKVFYSGSTNTSNGLKQNFHNGIPLIVNLSESFHASSWWICKDNLSDKADEGVDIYVTHPSTEKCGSNGMLQSVTDVGNGNVTTYWKSNYAIVPYLVSIAVTNYVEYNSSVVLGTTTMPIINYVYPEELAFHQANLDQVPNYITFFSNLFGDYPFKNEKYGHCQWEWNGGMEHQTMSSMVNFSQRLTVHELAHQWFGDKITCGTWKDIWLNEGFATYLTALVVENLNGQTDFNNWKSSVISSVTAQPNGSVYINNDADALNESRIFSSRLTYDKGAMVLHMLRFKMGDTAFFQAINNYVNDAELAYNFAITTDLRTHLEAVYGQSLVEFFADWVYGEGYPTFDVTLHQMTSSSHKYIVFNQSQSHTSVGFFETPIDVIFTGTNGESITKTFTITQNFQQFDFSDVPFQVAQYTVNPNFNILCKVNAAIIILSVEDENITLYPNPAKESIHLNATNEILSIEIYSNTGQLVYKQENINQLNYEIDVESFETGNYYVTVKTMNNSHTKTFIKK